MAEVAHASRVGAPVHLYIFREDRVWGVTDIEGGWVIQGPSPSVSRRGQDPRSQYWAVPSSCASPGPAPH